MDTVGKVSLVERISGMVVLDTNLKYSNRILT